MLYNDGSNYDRDRCYGFHDDPKKFDRANTECVKLEGNLASFRTQAQLNFLLNMTG